MGAKVSSTAKDNNDKEGAASTTLDATTTSSSESSCISNKDDNKHNNKSTNNDKPKSVLVEDDDIDDEESNATQWHAVSDDETRQATRDRILHEDNYYAILGVASGELDNNNSAASPDDIRRAYRSLMRWLHPDKLQQQRHDTTCPISNSLLAAKVNEAYRVLSDPQQRAAYDKQRQEHLPLTSTTIWFAKHTAGSPLLPKVTNPLASHTVHHIRDLLEGDHIYYFLSNTTLQARHGIVVQTPPMGSCCCVSVDNNNKDDNETASVDLLQQEIRVVDLGAAATTRSFASPIRRPQRQTAGLIREVSLKEFLPHRRHRTTLKRAEYNQSAWDCRFKLIGAYRDTPDLPHNVTQRARRLCLLGNSNDNNGCGLSSSSNGGETAAFWCKTGKRYSGQAPKYEPTLQRRRRLVFSHILAESTHTAAHWTSRTAAALALTATGVAAAEVTGLVSQGTLASGGAAVYGALVNNPLTAVAVGGAVLCAAAGVAVVQHLSHRQWRRAPAWHVIQRITQLESRDRRMAAQQHANPQHDGGPAEALARLLDACVSPADTTANKDEAMPWCDDASSIAAYVANQFHYHFQQYLRHCPSYYQGGSEAVAAASQQPQPTQPQQQQSGDADAAMDFAVQTLVRCELFHAILDLPDPTDGSEISYIVTTLKSCEFHLLECQALYMLPSELEVRRVDPPAPSWTRQYRLGDDTFLDNDDEDEEEPKALFQIKAQARSVVPSNNHSLQHHLQHAQQQQDCSNNANNPNDLSLDVLALDSFKVADDFYELHDILVELHPRVQTLKPPPRSSDDPRAFHLYLSNLLRLSLLQQQGLDCSYEDDEKDDDNKENRGETRKKGKKKVRDDDDDDDYYYQQQHCRSIDDYLHHLQMLQVQEQIVAFVSRSSREAWQLWLERGNMF